MHAYAFAFGTIGVPHLDLLVTRRSRIYDRRETSQVPYVCCMHNTMLLDIYGLDSKPRIGYFLWPFASVHLFFSCARSVNDFSSVIYLPLGTKKLLLQICNDADTFPRVTHKRSLFLASPLVVYTELLTNQAGSGLQCAYN